MGRFELILIFLFLSIFSFGQQLERPPQFILISFDGSKSANFWKETFSLGAKANAQFSYFISGVYFLKNKDRLNYHPPKRKAGSSDIGFAVDDNNDIKRRTEFVWQALNDKHPAMEIGSHVNGHFDGTFWTFDEWKQEFLEFHRLVSQVFSLYPTINTTFKSQWESTINSSIKGFRAPLLAGQNATTAEVLKEFRYSYDAGQVLKNKWPYKHTPDLWNVGLTRIALAGTKRETVAMDYNVLYGQCNGEFNPTNSGECKEINDELLEYFEKQTYVSYVQAFLKSYYGNRAPLSIGHHFSLWNKGVYWRALQKFVLDVCQLPEVKCITHIELVEWMDAQNVRWGYSFFNKMNQGLFSKTDIPAMPNDVLNIDLEPFHKKVSSNSDIRVPEISKMSEKIMLKGDLSEAHNEVSDDVDMENYRVKKVGN